MKKVGDKVKFQIRNCWWRCFDLDAIGSTKEDDIVEGFIVGVHKDGCGICNRYLVQYSGNLYLVIDEHFIITSKTKVWKPKKYPNLKFKYNKDIDCWVSSFGEYKLMLRSSGGAWVCELNHDGDDLFISDYCKSKSKALEEVFKTIELIRNVRLEVFYNKAE